MLVRNYLQFVTVHIYLYQDKVKRMYEQSIQEQNKGLYITNLTYNMNNYGNNFDKVTETLSSCVPFSLTQFV